MHKFRVVFCLTLVVLHVVIMTDPVNKIFTG